MPKLESGKPRVTKPKKPSARTQDRERPIKYKGGEVRSHRVKGGKAIKTKPPKLGTSKQSGQIKVPPPSPNPASTWGTKVFKPFIKRAR